MGAESGQAGPSAGPSLKRKTPPVHEAEARADGKRPPYASKGDASSSTKARKQKVEHEEKRLRRFRPKAPNTFTEIYARATTQRFYVLSRSRCGAPTCPEEKVEITGSTGNIYVVHIAQQPTCSCPHALAGHQCKHIVFVLARVLRARLELVYQLALLSTELVEIFANAPAIEVGDDAAKPPEDKNRKAVEGDCPICFSSLEGGETVYCRATCGQNIHKACFEMWAATKSKDKVTCPMCRTLWQGDDDLVKKIKNTGVVGPEGYVNVADQLGISRQQGGVVMSALPLTPAKLPPDTSTYYHGPSRRYRGYYGRRW